MSEAGKPRAQPVQSAAATVVAALRSTGLAVSSGLQKARTLIFGTAFALVTATVGRPHLRAAAAEAGAGAERSWGRTAAHAEETVPSRGGPAVRSAAMAEAVPA